MPASERWEPADAPAVSGGSIVIPSMIQIQEKKEKGCRFVWNAAYGGELEKLGLERAADFDSLTAERGLLRDIGPRRNYRLAGEEDEFFLKVHREGRRWMRRPLGQREWINHLLLMEAGLNVPTPVAWGFGGGYSFFMSRGCGEVTAEDVARGWESLPPKERRNLTRRLAHMVERLHEAGFFHRDLYLCHFIMRDGEPVLIDLQRLARNPVFSRHRRIKDLSALLYSSRRLPFSRTDRLRFFIAYWRGGRGSTRRKRMIKAVEAKARKIETRRKAKGLM